MHSSMRDSSGWDGGLDAEQRLEAALVQIGTVLDDTLAGSMLSLRPERLGRLFDLHGIDEAKFAALKLAMVARADACDAARTTGAVSTRVWLRTTQRMSVKDASAAVNLANDLDRTVILTAAALARGELSFRHAQVIAFAIKDLPKYVSPDQLVEAEKYLIAESRQRNPDDVRSLGKHLLQVLAPEEWERRLGEALAREEAAAARKRSLCFMANGIPGSETVVIKLPVVEMEVLRKLVEALVAGEDSGDGPDERPLDQKRGDAFAELVAQWAKWQAAPNRGRGRDCVTVLIHLQQLMNGTGFGTIEDLNPVRPMPCNCQTADAQRQAQRKNAKRVKRARGSESGESGPGESRGGDGDTLRRPEQNADSGDGHHGPEPGTGNGADNAAAADAYNGDGTNGTDGAPAATDGAPDSGGAPPADTGAPESDAMTDVGSSTGRADTDNCGEATAPVGDVRGADAERATTAPNGQPVKEKPPPEPADHAGVGDRLPAPREPGQPPQPNTATGPAPTPGAEPGTDTEPEERYLGAEDDADLDSELEFGEDAAGPEAALDTDDTDDTDDGAVDPHDGCRRCGGGGSARITGLRGEPLSVATIRRMACDANIIPVVLGGNGDVLDVGMAERFFTEAQRRALAVRDGSHCHFPRCQVPERRCVAHHMKPWEEFGPTNLDNGVLLCKSHHTFVHHKGWTVRMGSHGHPEYIPPEWVDPHQIVRRP